MLNKMSNVVYIILFLCFLWLPSFVFINSVPDFTSIYIGVISFFCLLLAIFVIMKALNNELTDCWFLLIFIASLLMVLSIMHPSTSIWFSIFGYLGIVLFFVSACN